MKMQMIDLKEILPDFFFCFRSQEKLSDETVIAPLQQSIQASGILTPLIVILENSEYKLMSGFRRFTAAQNLEFKQIPVKICESDDSPHTFFEILLEQSTHSAFNLIQKSNILTIASEINMDEPLYLALLDLLDIPAKADLIQQIISMQSFHPTLKQYIEKYDLSFKQVQSFFMLKLEEQQLFAELGFELQIRGVELLKIMDWTHDIAKRDDESIVNVLLQNHIVEMIRQADMPRNEKIERIKTALIHTRFPKMTELSQQLVELTKQLSLPSQIQIGWDKNHESPGLQLNARLKKTNDLQAIQDFLNDDSQNLILQQIIDLL